MGLLQRWQVLQERIDKAVALYDDGHRKVALPRLRRIWDDFLNDENLVKVRSKLEDGEYEEGISGLVNRLYLELDEEENQQELWDLCWEICERFDPEKFWLEQYASTIGLMMQRKGWYKECDEWFAGYMYQEPDEPAYAAKWAECLVERGNCEGARELLDEEICKYPECDDITLEFYLVAWKVYQKLGDMDKVMICRKRLEELDPELTEE